MEKLKQLSQEQQLLINKLFRKLSKRHFVGAEGTLVDVLNVLFDKTLGEERIVQEYHMVDFILNHFNKEYLEWASCQNLDIKKEAQELSKGDAQSNFLLANMSNPFHLTNLLRMMEQKLAKVVKEGKVTAISDKLHDQNFRYSV